MSSSNPPEPSSEIFSFGGKREMRQANDPEKRKKGTNSAPYSRHRIGILSVFFSSIVGAFMLADNYERLNDRKTANLLRFCFLVGVPSWWFIVSLISILRGISVYSMSISLGVMFISWFMPMVVLDVLYRRWRKAWIVTNGEIVSGNGSGRALLYVILYAVVFIMYLGSAPQQLEELYVRYAESLPKVTFVNGSFSIDYPSNWEVKDITNNPNCGQFGFECVKMFNFAGGSGALVVTRNNNLLERLAPLSLTEEANWNNMQSLSYLKSLEKFETLLDGYTTLRHNFAFTDRGDRSTGAIIITKTDQELYTIIAVAGQQDYALLEEALATIQLDQ